jgi:hypothetical protein
MYTTQNNGFIDPVLGHNLAGGPYGTVAATGTVQADAAALPYQFNRVTGADAAKGVILPAADESRIGAIISIDNTVAAILKVYPPVGGTIGEAAANANAAPAASTVSHYQVVGKNAYRAWTGTRL